MEIVAVWLLPRQHAANQEEEMIEKCCVQPFNKPDTPFRAISEEAKTFLRVSMHVLLCAH